MTEPELDLHQILGAAFTAFEAIRQSAREYEDRARNFSRRSSRPAPSPPTAGTLS